MAKLAPLPQQDILSLAASDVSQTITDLQASGDWGRTAATVCLVGACAVWSQMAPRHGTCTVWLWRVPWPCGCRGLARVLVRRDDPRRPRHAKGSVRGPSWACCQWRHGSATPGTPLKIAWAVLLTAQRCWDMSGDIHDPYGTWMRSANQHVVQPLLQCVQRGSVCPICESPGNTHRASSWLMYLARATLKSQNLTEATPTVALTRAVGGCPKKFLETAYCFFYAANPRRVGGVRNFFPYTYDQKFYQTKPFQSKNSAR